MVPERVPANGHRPARYGLGHIGWSQRRHSAGAECEPGHGLEIGRLVGVHELLHRGRILASALRDPLPSAAAAVRIPWWAWSGGLFGAVFIGLAVILVPQLGAATFFVLLVTGQIAASVALDHFGWLGLPQRSMDLQRLLGVVLLIGGVALIRR